MPRAVRAARVTRPVARFTRRGAWATDATRLATPLTATNDGDSNDSHGADDGHGTRLVAIPTGPSDVLTLEVRTPTDLDQAVCHSGGLITRVDTAAPSGEAPMRVVDANPGSEGCADPSDPQIDPALTDAAHTAGDTFRDEELGVEVRVLEAEEDGPHRVRVTRW